MSLLIDTNVMLRMAEPTHLKSETAHWAVKRLLQRGESLVIVPQNLYEFWVVASRPLLNNGLGFTTSIVAAEITKLEQIFALIDDENGVLVRWKQLVVNFDVKGKPAHDARLVAAMEAHGVPSLLTFNKADFERYTTISVLTPEEVLAD